MHTPNLVICYNEVIKKKEETQMNPPKKKAKINKSRRKINENISAENKKNELIKILLEVCKEYGAELRVPK